MMIRGSLRRLLLQMGTLYAKCSDEGKHKIVIYGWLHTLGGTMTFSEPGEPDDSFEVDFSKREASHIQRIIDLESLL